MAYMPTPPGADPEKYAKSLQEYFRMFAPLGGAAELAQFGEAMGKAGIPYAEEAIGGVFPKMSLADRAMMAPKTIQTMLGGGEAQLTAFSRQAEPEIYGLIQRTGLTQQQIQQALSKLLQEGMLRRITGSVPVDIDRIKKIASVLTRLSDVGHSTAHGPWGQISSLAQYLSQLLR
jgi:hypothetical protein